MRTIGRMLVISIVMVMMLGMLPPTSQVGAESSREPTLDGFTEASTGLPNNGEYATVALGDFNKDGFLDIVSGILAWASTNDGLDVFLNNNGAQSWTKSSTGLPIDGGYGQVAAGDIDNDGDDDIVAPHENYWSGEAADGVRVYLSDGQASPTFSAGNHPVTTGAYQAAHLVDINKDGNLDIVAAGETAGVRVWLGDGGSTWTAANTGLPSTGYYYGIDHGDLDKDGNIDIAVGSQSSGVNVYLGDGGTSWTEDSTGLPSTGEWWGINITDFDNDGNPDILTSHYFDGGLRVYTGNGGSGGAMSFSSESSGLPTGGNYCQLKAADINVDGDMDIWVVESYQATGGARLYEGDGGDGGSLTWTRNNDATLPGSGYYAGADIGDLDNDGDLDLVASDSGLSAGGTVGIRVFLVDIIDVVFRPVPNAGSDQTVFIGETVQLDASLSGHTGSGSATGYKWNISSQPQGSSIMLSDDTIVNPTFVPIVPGQYVLSLAVQDGVGMWGSWEDLVNITANELPNVRPTANAGPDQTKTIFDTVQLDGSGSTDDADVVEYNWNISAQPTESSIALSDETIVDPTFTPEYIGTYKFTLTVKDDNNTWGVNDGITVTVNPAGSGPPEANAGPDQTIELGDPFELNGSASTDDQSIVEYDWTVDSQPTSSNLVVGDISAQELTPGFEGIYDFSLMVKDNDNLWSLQPDIMRLVVLPMNHPPEVEIDSPEDDAVLLSTVTIDFDGSSSEDPEGFDLTYLWTSDIDGELGTEVEFSTILSVGKHTITLAVTDDHDNTVSTSIEIEVKLDELPTAVLSASGTLFLKGEKVNFDGTGSSDDQGAVSEFFFDFGDGKDSGWISTPKSSHLYKDTGTYSATLKVKDSHEQESVLSEAIVVTVGARPNADLSVDEAVIKKGKPVTFDASGSTDADGTIVEYFYNFGDGTDSGWTSESTVTHTFVKPNEYTISVKVRDDHDFESLNLATVKVKVKAPSDPGGGNDLSGALFPIIAVVIIIVVVLAVLMIMKKKKAASAPSQPEVQDQSQQQAPPPPPGVYDQGGYQEGYDQSGYQEGYDQGGYQQGYDQGQNQGYEQGYDQQGYDQTGQYPPQQ